MRILLIEDSVRLQRSVSTGLRSAGYAVDVAGDGIEGLRKAMAEPFDVIILDLMLPGMDGLTMLRRLRDAGNSTHVLILTAKDTVDDRVNGLRTGGDDYLIKPFAFDELLARVEALARRAHGVKHPVITVGNLVVDTSARQVKTGRETVTLAPREYALLEYLAMRNGAVVSREEIEQHIYDSATDVMSNVVDSAICALRRKIDPAKGPSFIETRRGMGYILRQPTA